MRTEPKQADSHPRHTHPGFLPAVLLFFCVVTLAGRGSWANDAPELLQPDRALTGMHWAGRPKASNKAKAPGSLRTGEAPKKSTAQRDEKTGGESEATKRGRQAHADWQPGEGYEKEVRLPSGKRADAVNFEKQDVKELKPNNPRAIKRGEKQVETYRSELEEKQGGQWTGKVETYEAGEKK